MDKLYERASGCAGRPPTGWLGKPLTRRASLASAVLMLLPILAAGQLRPRGERSGVNSHHSQTRSSALQRASFRAAYHRLPLSFEPNRGQSAPAVRFLAHAPFYTLFLTDRAAVVSPSGCAACWVRMSLAGSRRPSIRGRDRLSGQSNYLLGTNKRSWLTGVPRYGRVAYHGIYPGIDLVYYGNPEQLEYDFVVAPYANPRRISFRLSGARGALQPRVNSEGDLQIGAADGRLLLMRPAAYQKDRAGNRRAIASRYLIEANGGVAISLGAYDRGKPLIIDPSLVYSTYLGGSGGDSATAIAVDGSGNVYVTGATGSSNFPLSPSGTTPLQKALAGSSDAFISKLNSTGTALVYSTYVGGSKYDKGTGIAVDSSGNAYVTGNTSSPDFPVTKGAFQTTYGGNGNSEAFVLELNSSGSTLTYSTYLGGSGGDFASGIAIDSAGNAYIAGSTTSPNFPVSNPLQKTLAGASDAFVTKLNPSGASLVYSTYLGGTQADAGAAIAIDSSDEAIVVGFTLSTNFPTQAALQPANGGGGDAFIAKFNAAGSALIYSTYFGGSGEDRALAVATDAAGDAYVTGSTQSANLLTTSGAYQMAPGGATDAFVVKLNPTGSQALYSTFLGGAADDQGNGVAVNAAGDAYILGSTTSANFPMLNPLQSAIDRGGCSSSCASNVFLSVLNPQGGGLIYSTYLGGSGPDYGQAITLDASGNAFVAGSTDSSDFPASGGAFQASYGGQGTTGNGFVAEISAANAPALALNPQSIKFADTAAGFSSAAEAVTLTNLGSEPLSISGASASSGFSIQSNSCGASLQPGGAQCVIELQFTPAAGASTTAATTGTLTVTDNAAGSPQTVALSGTASTPAPSYTFTPSSLTFGNQLVGTTSTPQALTLTNSGTASLSITAATVSGAFTQTNNCVTTLAPGATCAFSVTFAPTTTTGTDSSNTSSTTASNTGSVSVTSNATGTVPTAAVTGSPVADFSLTLTGPSTIPTAGATSASVTVAAGAVLPSFTGNITFACSTTVTCTFNPTQITPGQTTTATVSGLAGTATAPNPNPAPFTITGTSGNQTFAADTSIAIQNFAISATPPLATVNAGQTATYNVTVSAVNGFNQAVTLACSTGLPALATCSFSPSSLTPGPNAPQSSVLTITTTAHSKALMAFPPAHEAPPPANHTGDLLVGLAALALLLSLAIAIRRHRVAWILPGLAVLMVLMLAACNMGYYGFVGGNPAPTGSPSGVYTVVISGTFTPAAGSTTQAATQRITSVNLAVQ